MFVYSRDFIIIDDSPRVLVSGGLESTENNYNSLIISFIIMISLHRDTSCFVKPFLLQKTNNGNPGAI